MDINALTIERRGKKDCFNCEKPGHLSRDCPNKKKAETSQSPLFYTPPISKKLPAKELYVHIHSLTTMLNEDEKEEFYQEAEKEGF